MLALSLGYSQWNLSQNPRGMDQNGHGKKLSLNLESISRTVITKVLVLFLTYASVHQIFLYRLRWFVAKSPCALNTFNGLISHKSYIQHTARLIMFANFCQKFIWRKGIAWFSLNVSRMEAIYLNGFQAAHSWTDDRTLALALSELPAGMGL